MKLLRHIALFTTFLSLHINAQAFPREARNCVVTNSVASDFFDKTKIDVDMQMGRVNVTYPNGERRPGKITLITLSDDLMNGRVFRVNAVMCQEE